VPVADILRYNSRTWPDRVALVAGDRRITFSELEQAVWRLADAGDSRGGQEAGP
jgi:non-ribosomal peptide synthetase component E (peptide arylation enzyme)